MNLTVDPWIPIVWEDGESETVSLREAFERGHEIQDLAVRPHERIAVMRLLICIAQAAADGPADYDDWKACQPRLAPSALDYLKRWHDAFEFFGSGQRFLQLDKVKKAAKKSGSEDGEGNCASKLDLALATGNNSTLFDNAGGTERTFTPAQLALLLLTYQCFSPGGTIGVAMWNGKPTPGWKSYPKPAPGQSNHAPCLPGSMVHAFLRGANLTETVHLNLLNKHVVERALGSYTWGRPIWEAMPASAEDKRRIANATTTYLGRLVPLSRAIRLEDDGRFLLLANALTYPAYPEAREPSATVVSRKQNGAPIRATLGGSLNRALWRELHSLTVKRIGLGTNGGPLALQNLSDDRPFDLWVGGMVADQAKPLDTLESVFHVPSAMLADPSQRAYEQGVEFANATEFRLRRAVSAYRRELGDDLNRPELRDRRRRVQDKATTQYWTDAEGYVNELLAVAENPALLGLDGAWQKTDWGRAICRAALAAYDHACPHDTPRQMRAYALGREALAATPPIQRSKEETE
ncbi:MAG: type I-E CRISPR-associated protein Cse1/CasA [bacterium]